MQQMAEACLPACGVKQWLLCAYVAAGTPGLLTADTTWQQEQLQQWQQQRATAAALPAGVQDGRLASHGKQD